MTWIKKLSLQKCIAERAEPMASLFGYAPGGDRFTQNENEKEVAQQKEEQKFYLRQDLELQIKGKHSVAQREKERDTEFGMKVIEEERRKLRVEAEEVMQRKKKEEVKWKDGLETQIATRSTLAREMRDKDRRDGNETEDVFTRGEGSAEEKAMQKKQEEKKTVSHLLKMGREKRERAEEEKRREKVRAEKVFEIDLQEIEQDKETNKQRKQYGMKTGEAQWRQIAEKRAGLEQEKEEKRVVIHATSLQLSDEVDDDCEDPKYRMKPLTRQQKLAMGGW